MPAFQVVSRTAPGLAPPKRQRRRLSPTWIAIYRVIRSMSISALFFYLVFRLTNYSDYTFVLLPALLSVFIANSRRFPLDQIVQSTPLYLVFTGLLALAYYSLVTAIVIIPHTLGHIHDNLIFVTTTLAWAVILQPAYVYFQLRVERRFNKRNVEANKAVEAFTSTLRDEIDLAQLRDRFLTVVQQTMQPYAVALWLRDAQQHKQESAQQAMEVLVGDDDPFIAHALRHLGALDISQLPQESPLVQGWQAQGMEVALPLATQGNLIGLLLVSMRLDGEDYSLEDRTLLDTLATEVAPALRVAQLVQEQQEQVREHERIEQELRTAQAIQRDFLPKDVPALPGWQFTPYYQPAREVGGDFYDFIELADGRLGLVIGDVTGKGMPAALVMATVHSILRSAAHHAGAPRDVLAEVNALLLPDLPPNMYVTCFYAILDPASGGLRYANAGHELPFHRQGARVQELRATGMPLGLLADSTYDEAEALLQPGDDVVFYSDGVVEAHNRRREMFGEQRLAQLVGAHAEGTDLIDGVLADLARFSGTDWEQEDDITLVAVRRSADGIAPDVRVLDSWILPSVAGADREAMQRAGAVARNAGLSAERCERLETAVAEATLNAMEHGNVNDADKLITFQVLATPDTLIVRIGDQGENSFDPGTPRPDIEAMLAGEQSPRGWGLFLMRSMVDEVRLDTTSGQHVIELRMALDA